MMHRIAITLALAFVFTTAFATDYYFSDCDKGCLVSGNPCNATTQGTKGDPFCLDPTGAYGHRSFEYLLDGSAPDVVPGDTIYLCAGACDGVGTGTYLLTVTGTDGGGDRYVIAPQVSGTATSPITITPYCVGTACETIILSGDSGTTPGSPDCSDVGHILDNNTTAADSKAYYRWLGDPNGDNTPNLIFEKTIDLPIYLTKNPLNWIIDGIEVRRTTSNCTGTSVLWNDGHIADAPGCGPGGNNQDGYAIKVSNLTGSLQITNSKFHHLCGFAFRLTDNPKATSILIADNEGYNIDSFTNDYNDQNVKYIRNYVHDAYDGISIEDRMHDIEAADNTIACLGVWRTINSGSQAGRCFAGIRATQGDNGSSYYNQSYNITVHRNKIYGMSDAYSGSGAVSYGWMQKGIEISAGCSQSAGCPNYTAPGFLVENNMIWYTRGSASVDSSYDRAGIEVTSPNGAIVRNNTIYASREWGIALSGGTSTINDNLVILTDVGQPLYIGSGATGSTFSNNNVWDDGTDPPLIGGGLVSKTCSQIGSFGTKNKCAATNFINLSGTKDTWDLHLTPGDTVNKDAGTAGATDDIDRQPRPQGPAWDIGADELVADTTPPAAPRNLRVVP